MTNETNFEGVFTEMAQEIIDQLVDYKLPQVGIDHIKEMIYFTVPGGTHQQPIFNINQ